MDFINTDSTPTPDEMTALLANHLDPHEVVTQVERTLPTQFYPTHGPNLSGATHTLTVWTYTFEPDPRFSPGGARRGTLFVETWGDTDDAGQIYFTGPHYTPEEVEALAELMTGRGLPTFIGDTETAALV